MSCFIMKRVQSLMMILCLCGLAQGAADLAVSVKVKKGPHYWTSGIDASVCVQNVGDEPADSVVLNVNLPANMSARNGYYLETTSQIKYAGGVKGPEIEYLPPGEAVWYYFAIFPPQDIDQNTPATDFEISASADMASVDTSPENNSVSATFTFEPPPAYADLAVTVFSDQDKISLGEIATFTITAINKGEIPADVSMSMDRGQFFGRYKWDFVSVSSGKGSPYLKNTHAGNNGFSLDPGESVTMTVQAKAKWPGESNVLVSVRNMSAPDYNQDNNHAAVTMQVDGEFPVFDLEPFLAMSPATAQPGGLVVQQMGVINNGPDDAGPLTLHTQVDDLTGPFGGVKDSGDFRLYDILESGPWDINVDGHAFSAKLPFLAAGSSATVTLIMRVRDNISTDSAVQTCIVTSDYWFEGGILPDPNWSLENPVDPNPYLYNNNASQVVHINLNGTGDQSDLEILQFAPQEVPLGQAYTYRLTAVNQGPNPTTTGKLGSIVPAGLTVVGVQGSRGRTNVAGRYVGLDDVPLAVGEAANLDITVVPQELGNKLVQAGVASGSFDPTYDNNLTGAVTNVKPDGPVAGGDLACVDTPDLVLDFIKVKRRGKFKKKEQQWQFKIQAKVAVTNVGTACATDRSDVKFYLSADSILDANDLLIASKKMKKVCPAKKPGKAPKPKKLSIKQKLPLGMNPVGIYLLAVADGDNVIAECDETNNIGVNVE